MKLNNNFLLREIAGCFVVVPVGEAATRFNGMFTINDTGVLLWKSLEEDISIPQLTDIIANEYDIDIQTAENDVNDFINKLIEINAISKN